MVDKIERENLEGELSFLRKAINDIPENRFFEREGFEHRLQEVIRMLGNPDAIIAVAKSGAAFLIEMLTKDHWKIQAQDEFDAIAECEFDVKPGLYYAACSHRQDSEDSFDVEWEIIRELYTVESMPEESPELVGEIIHNALIVDVIKFSHLSRKTEGIGLGLQLPDDTITDFSIISEYLSGTYSDGAMDEFVEKCLEITGPITNPNGTLLPSPAIRVKLNENGKVYAIGHFLKDEWLYPAEDLRK